jgi:hypothetical protein
MGVGITRDAAIEALTRLIIAVVWVEHSGAETETELHERDAETSAGSVLCGVGCVEKVGEEETDELEGHGYHGVPDEAEKGSDGETFDEDLITKGAGGEDCSFPVGWCCVRGGLFICLCYVSMYLMWVAWL